MSEPRQRDAAVGRLVVSQLAHHSRLCTCMTQHVDEIEHHNVQVVLVQLLDLLHESVGLGRGVDLMIRERLMTAVSVQQGLNQRFFVQVLAFLFVLVDPQFGKHLGNLVRHQSAEDGIAGILCCSGKNREIQVLVDVKLVANFLCQHAPLVKAEVIQHYEEHLLLLVE